MYIACIKFVLESALTQQQSKAPLRDGFYPAADNANIVLTSKSDGSPSVPKSYNSRTV